MKIAANVRHTMSEKKSIARKIRAAVNAVWLSPVYFYRRFISPLKPVPTCRFRPTCSEYAIEAVKEWGIIIGTALTLWRLMRCNPFCKGGRDPVPVCPWKNHRRRMR